MDASHSELSRDSIEEDVIKPQKVEPTHPDRKHSDGKLLEDVKSDKAQSQDEKEGDQSPLDVDFDAGSNKCKSV